MKICMIVKYPPIEGGVSTKNFWLAKGLGEAGHEIFVVTNSYEVEDEYRITLNDEDISTYQPKGVAVFNTNPFSKQKFIPYSNPYVSKLAAIASKIHQKVKFDVIYADYFEPYCVAGFLVKSLTGVPLIVRHAGSDISRLFFDSNLHHIYLNILKQSDLILTTPGMDEFIASYGIDRNKIDTSAMYGLNEHYFSPNIQAENLSAVVENKDSPIILMYGKGGHTKGSIDILHILKNLKHDATLLYITSKSTKKWLEAYAEKISLNKKVVFHGFVSNIQIPKYIKAADLTCFLERDFPIGIHGPIVPREVLAVGGCLVISKEIHEKQYFKDKLTDMKNVCIVDPKDHANAANKIDKLLSDKALAEDIGLNGNKVFSDINSHEMFMQTHLEIFNKVIIKSK